MNNGHIDVTALNWRTATRSMGGNCVQVAPVEGGGVAVRNSRMPDGPVIVYTAAEFAAFLDGARRGEFDDLI